MPVALRKIVLHNFRSFLGRHELVLPKTGLVVLHGHNKLTRGSSNAGKSNVLLALAYAFGYANRPVAALQCWFTDDPMKVEVHLDTADGPAVLERSEKYLRLNVKGRLYKGGARAVEAELDRLCGVGADLREALTYRNQVKPRKFLDVRQRPGERDAAIKDFLIQVLKLEVLDKEVDRAAKSLAPIEERRRVAETALQAAQAALGAARNDPALSWVPETDRAFLEDLASAETYMDAMAALLRGAGERKAQVERARQAAVAAFKPDTAELDRLTGLLAKCREHVKALGDLEQTRVSIYRDESEKLARDLQALRACAARLDLKRRQLAEKQRVVENFNAGVCSMCQRPWREANAAVLKAEAEAAALANEVYADQLRVASLAELEEKAANHVFAPDLRLEKLRAAEASLREQIAAESAKVKQRAEPDQTELLDAMEDVQAAMKAYSAAQLACHERESALALVRQRNRMGSEAAASARDRVARAQADALGASRSFDEAQQQWKQEADYAELLKGFRNKIFDEALTSIGQRATEVVGMLPNAAHVAVEFRSERLTAAGAVQDRITPVIYLNGVERALEDVSGGGLTSIELAVDLAVAQAVSERLGCNLNWIVLDEAFGGHDPVTKNACLEMLQRYAADKLVVIVDHHSEFREMVAERVTVEYDGKLSSFKKAA